jgi:hypothetical protein
MQPFFLWLKRRWIIVMLFAYLLSGVYFVAPDQQAVVVRFGQVVAKSLAPGVHYSLPWPIESVYKLKVLETKRLTIGIEMPDQALGRVAAENPTEYLTGDQNLIIKTAAEMGERKFGEYLKRLNEEITGIAVSDLKLTGEAGAVLRVEFVYRGKNEAQQYYLVLRDGAWKIDRVDESERIKTLVPYGSDATGKE